MNERDFEIALMVSANTLKLKIIGEMQTLYKEQ